MCRSTTVTSVAIGRFDGLHVGHRALFAQLDEHGALVLIDTKKSNLTPHAYMARYTSLPMFAYLLDVIKDMQADEFISMICRDFPALRRIVVGEDFRFAASRSAGITELRKLFHGDVVTVSEYKIGDIGVHSKYIRALLVQGDVASAARYLGRRYEICGHIVSGQGIGAQKLVATINLSVRDFLLPHDGVYATYTYINERKYRSVTFLGNRISTDGNYAVETHILEDFDECANGDIYISFVQKIRDNTYFETIESLKHAITHDVESALKILLNDR